jgi:hypothetical protein
MGNKCAPKSWMARTIWQGRRCVEASTNRAQRKGKPYNYLERIDDFYTSLVQVSRCFRCNVFTSYLIRACCALLYDHISRRIHAQMCNISGPKTPRYLHCSLTLQRPDTCANLSNLPATPESWCSIYTLELQTLCAHIQVFKSHFITAYLAVTITNHHKFKARICSSTSHIPLISSAHPRYTGPICKKKEQPSASKCPIKRQWTDHLYQCPIPIRF